MSRKKTRRRKRRARSGAAPERALAENRRARRDYTVLEDFEAGIALTGPEVKSCRTGGADLKDAYGKERGGEIFLVNCHIAPWQHASGDQGNPNRARKLLLHAGEVQRISGKLSTTGLTLVPLRIYVRNGWIKVRVGLARGRSQRDRRDAIRAREAEREIREALG